MARPHDSPDCSCAGCVAHDLGDEAWADFQHLGVPYDPWMAPHLRQADREARETSERFAPVVRAMGRAAARWADRNLAELLRDGTDLTEAVAVVAEHGEAPPIPEGLTEFVYHDDSDHPGISATSFFANAKPAASGVFRNDFGGALSPIAFARMCAYYQRLPEDPTGGLRLSRPPPLPPHRISSIHESHDWSSSFHCRQCGCMMRDAEAKAPCADARNAESPPTPRRG